jgi:alkylation response protein AidB-like acyl-CoA dehydrogenase
VDFALSEEQERLRDAARELLRRECPSARVREAMAKESGHDPELQRVFAEAGWLGCLVPEALGGAGLGLLDAAVLLEEMGRALVPGPFLVSSVSSVVALRELGSAPQQRRWLPRIASGEAIATLALAEPPEARCDPARLRARARRRGDGFELGGTKSFVEHAHTADLWLCACRGPELFAVERGTPGARVLPQAPLDETRRPCGLRLRGVRVPPSARLAGGRSPARRARGLRRALDASAVAVAADSLGAAQQALDLAVAYVKAREQFGRPVGSFQAVQHLAAECAARLEPARALLWYAAWAIDARRREASLAASMAKACCTDVHRFVARSAVELHGGIGFTWENDMHLFLKRALANAQAFGDAEHHRERVAELSGF